MGFYHPFTACFLLSWVVRLAGFLLTGRLGVNDGILFIRTPSNLKIEL